MGVNIVKEKKRRADIRRFYASLPWWTEEFAEVMHKTCVTNMGNYDSLPKEQRDRYKGK